MQVETLVSTSSNQATGAAAADPLGKRIAFFAYGVIAHGGFLAVFLYLVGFLGNFGVPKSIDSGPTRPLWQALLIDGLLLGFFAVQHSVMARPGFKRWWTRFVPQPIERSTYVMISNVLMAAILWFWQPIGGTVWSVQDTTARGVLYALFGLGCLQVVVSSLLINHFDLFGTRQVWFYLRGQDYKPLPFEVPGTYKLVRHPLYVGWLMTFWATPTMTAAHLVFAALTTAYILIAIQFEERDLVTVYGRTYTEYRKRVPMLIPRFGSKPQSPHIEARPRIETPAV
jgi:protein-S-isoprenylcysteine O-methyltransferase Ste14